MIDVGGTATWEDSFVFSVSSDCVRHIGIESIDHGKFIILSAVQFGCIPARCNDLEYFSATTYAHMAKMAPMKMRDQVIWVEQERRRVFSPSYDRE